MRALAREQLHGYGLSFTSICMKTTVDIADSLLAEAKLLAAEQQTTVRALVEEGLRHAVEERKRTSVFVLRSVSFGGNGVRPDIREGSWERIRELIHEGRGA